MTTSGAQLLSLWQRLSPLPGGKRMFSMLLGARVPYTGSIKPRVLELRPGFARVALRDRRAVRQHLGSVHAVALTNLGEVSSGLAMLCGMPRTVRGIVTSIKTDYTKKARGLLVAECQCEVPSVTGDTDFVVEAVVRDEAGDVVSRTEVTWRLGLVPTKPGQ